MTTETEVARTSTVRVDSDIIELAEEIMEEQEGRWASRSDLLRAGLTCGLESIQAEYLAQQELLQVGRQVRQGGTFGADPGWAVGLGHGHAFQRPEPPDRTRSVMGMAIPLYAEDAGWDPTLTLNSEPVVDDPTHGRVNGGAHVKLASRYSSMSQWMLMGLFVEVDARTRRDRMPVVVVERFQVGGGMELLPDGHHPIENFTQWPWGDPSSNPGIREWPIVRIPNLVHLVLRVMGTAVSYPDHPWVGRVFAIARPMIPALADLHTERER